MTTQELLLEMLSLPVEERAFIADTLFKSLNQPDAAVDAAWLEVAESRLQEIQASAVEPVNGTDVIARLRAKLN